MQTILISDIIVSDRQRRDMGDLDRDFASVKDIGLIQPIVVEKTSDHNYRLLVGGRRLSWLKANGFTELFHGTSCDPKRPGYILSTEVSERAKQEAELLENINRHNLNWREECCAIARIHRARWIENKALALPWSQKHTGRLLNVRDDAKVAYALQVADELRDDPDGEISKCETFPDAMRVIIQRAERDARAEQERRREILRRIEEKIKVDGQDMSPQDQQLAVEGATQEKTFVNLSHMMRLGEFERIAEEEFPPDIYPCAIVFDCATRWHEQTTRLLRANSYIILVGDSSTHELVLWNQLGLTPEEGRTFTDSVRSIGILKKGNPVSPCPSPTNVVTAHPDDASLYPPAAVLDFLLKATTIPGDSVLLPTGGPVKTILELGRRPICFDTDPEQHERNKQAVVDYYKGLYSDNVEFG